MAIQVRGVIMLRATKYFSVAVLLFGAIGANCVAGGEGRPGAELRCLKTLSYEDWTDERPCAIRSADGGYYIASHVARKVKAGDYQFKMVLWKLDAACRQQWVRPLEIRDEQSGRAIELSKCLALESEPILLVSSFAGPYGHWLVRLDHDGRITTSMKLDLGKGTFEMWDFEKVMDGFLVCGRKNDDAWTAKIDLDGKVLWDRTFDRGEDEYAMNAAVHDDGGFVLAVNSGKYNKFGAGPSQVWLIDCGANGESRGETVFGGRHPDAAVRADGSVIVVYNSLDFPQVQIGLRAFGGGLTELWKIDNLYSADTALGSFNVMADSNGDILVAGAGHEKSGIWKVSGQGRNLWYFPVEGTDLCVNYDSVIRITRGCAIAASIPSRAAMPVGPDGKRLPDEHWDMSNIVFAAVVETGGR